MKVGPLGAAGPHVESLPGFARYSIPRPNGAQPPHISPRALICYAVAKGETTIARADIETGRNSVSDPRFGVWSRSKLNDGGLALGRVRSAHVSDDVHCEDACLNRLRARRDEQQLPCAPHFGQGRGRNGRSA